MEETTNLRVLSLRGNQHATKRWQPEDREEAYQHYRHSNRRSLRSLSLELEIPFPTLREWSRFGNWQMRLFEDDQRDAETIQQAAKMQMINHVDLLVDNLLELAYNGTKEDKIKYEATRTALALMGFSEIKKVQQDILDTKSTRARPQESAGDIKSLTREELAERVNRRAFTNDEEPVDAEYTDLATVVINPPNEDDEEE